MSIVQASSHKSTFLVVLSFIYIGFTLSGSIFYLNLLQSNLSNDFWWTHFNTTGTHRFLAAILLQEPSTGPLAIDDPKYALIELYNSSTTSVITYPSQSTLIKHATLSSFEAAISGLRQMNGCHAPWIATQYSLVDFRREWELANSLERQRRCETQQRPNAAVYLEASMRNINHEQFIQCWGDSFTIAIANELKSSISGREWLQATLENPVLFVHDEVIWWLDNDLSNFVVQWQNYILLGLVQTVTSRNGKWRLTDQTSMKMYWSFARDLWACSSNASGIGGLSLVRSSSRFAFENVSIQTVMITLPPAMSWGAHLFEQHVGPYGSIDVHYILPPGKLVTLISNLDKGLKALCFTNVSFSSLCKGFTVSNTYQTVMPSSITLVAPLYVQKEQVS
ncbi:hypothetical protein AC1031_010789 [Aphanomyces cochlioides]|nr:hypothetical protein AC1031_010789 [Aphanomyces cochlioides]